MPLTKKQILAILDQNKGKSFVRRVLEPDKYPTLDNGDGSVSTHSMAAEVDEDGNWYVFPTVLMTKNGLRRFDVWDAFSETKKTGNLIPFGKNKDAAIDFSRSYKKVWER